MFKLPSKKNCNITSNINVHNYVTKCYVPDNKDCLKDICQSMV